VINCGIAMGLFGPIMDLGGIVMGLVSIMDLSGISRDL
jgi:hypothetical protein